MWALMQKIMSVSLTIHPTWIKVRPNWSWHSILLWLFYYFFFFAKEYTSTQAHRHAGIRWDADTPAVGFSKPAELTSCRLLENHYAHHRPRRRRTTETRNGDVTGQRDSWWARRGILHIGKWTRIPQQLLMTIIKTHTPWQHISASDDSGTSMAALFTCLFGLAVTACTRLL